MVKTNIMQTEPIEFEATYRDTSDSGFQSEETQKNPHRFIVSEKGSQVPKHKAVYGPTREVAFNLLIFVVEDRVRQMVYGSRPECPVCAGKGSIKENGSIRLCREPACLEWAAKRLPRVRLTTETPEGTSVFEFGSQLDEQPALG